MFLRAVRQPDAAVTWACVAVDCEWVVWKIHHTILCQAELWTCPGIAITLLVSRGPSIESSDYVNFLCTFSSIHSEMYCSRKAAELAPVNDLITPSSSIAARNLYYPLANISNLKVSAVPCTWFYSPPLDLHSDVCVSALSLLFTDLCQCTPTWPV